MLLLNRYKITFLWVIFFFLFLSAFSNPTLRDIETAILEGDFNKAKTLSQQFIDQKPLKADLDQALYFLGLSDLRLEHPQEARNTFNLLLSGMPEEPLRD